MVHGRHGQSDTATNLDTGTERRGWEGTAGARFQQSLQPYSIYKEFTLCGLLCKPHWYSVHLVHLEPASRVHSATRSGFTAHRG